MQFFYDISELAVYDRHTGIQRVVRSVLAQLLANPPAGYTVEPVLARPGREGYFYARRYTQAFLGQTHAASPQPEDSPIEPKAGDIFLRMELQPEVVLLQADFYTDLRSQGVQLFFGVHDLLPIWKPQYFPQGTEENHSRWLGRLARADGVVCVSRSVADEVEQWVTQQGPVRLKPLRIGWFHLGSDLADSKPTKGLPLSAPSLLGSLAAAPSFLMVGTIEPRKGHTQTLAAFEQLWKAGHQVNLVVVGKPGWHTEALVQRMKSHPELGRRLHWPHEVSDEYLDQIYAASTCLLAPSEGEGFGLPLIEAARHHLPVLARDLDVFKEVAGEHALYFSGREPAMLAAAVQKWLELHAQGLAPQSEPMPRLTWQQSTAQLLEVVLGGNWYKHWVADAVVRLHGNDSRLKSNGGRRAGRQIHSTGQAGHLVYGPYIYMPPGNYEVRVKGSFAGHPGANPNIEVAMQGGNHLLARTALYGHGLAENTERVLPFRLDAECNDLEIRVWVEASNMVTLDMLEIHPV